MKKGFMDVNRRVDSLGKQLNTFDDAPTEDELKELTKRVDNLEKYKKFVSA